MTQRRSLLIRQLHARPRLFISLLAGVLLGLFLPGEWHGHGITRLIVAWNFAVVLYLILVGTMMYGATHIDMRQRALSQDEGRMAILFGVVFAAVASLAAIIMELAVAKSLSDWSRYAHIGLAGFTILSSWAFTHTMFALHYAHDFYGAQNDSHRGGLQFPGTDRPDYGDFMYFSFVIGTSAQTADVSLTSSHLRRIGLLHCVLAFLFNTTVLALTINIAASLI